MQGTAPLTQLKEILTSGKLSDSVRKNGERLLQRLSSPIRIALLGPDRDSKNQLHEMLTDRPIQDTAISIEPLNDDLSFEHADICLWCTSEFGEAELAHWQRAPDRLKDHSFLVPLATQDKVHALFSEVRLNALGDIAEQEFHSMFPIMLGSLNDAPSGTFFELVSEITKLVRSGRAADRDNAEFFVQTHHAALAASPDAADQEKADDRQSEPVSDAAQPVIPQHSADRAPVEIYEKAFSHICEGASHLATPISTGADDEINLILSVCQQTSETVAEIFSENPSRDPDFLLLKEDVLCAADKLLLMSLEGGVAPAIAAVTTLLQTRREMETRMVP